MNGLCSLLFGERVVSRRTFGRYVPFVVLSTYSNVFFSNREFHLLQEVPPSARLIATIIRSTKVARGGLHTLLRESVRDSSVRLCGPHSLVRGMQLSRLRLRQVCISVQISSCLAAIIEAYRYHHRRIWI